MSLRLLVILIKQVVDIFLSPHNVNSALWHFLMYQFIHNTVVEVFSSLNEHFRSFDRNVTCKLTHFKLINKHTYNLFQLCKNMKCEETYDRINIPERIKHSIFLRIKHFFGNEPALKNAEALYKSREIEYQSGCICR